MQAQIAIETADVIVFLCDIRAGLVADDRDIAVMLKKSGKPVIVAINKIDQIGGLPLGFYEFYELGFDKDPIALSSVHGSGTGRSFGRDFRRAPGAGNHRTRRTTVSR